MSKEERFEIRECSRNNNTKSKYIYDNKENNSISFDKQTIINLLNKQNQQLAELKAKTDLRANIVSKEVNKICKQVIEENEQLKAENERLANLNNQYVTQLEQEHNKQPNLQNLCNNLQQQLKEKDELEQATKESLYASRELYEKEKVKRWELERQLKFNTKQVCEKIRKEFTEEHLPFYLDDTAIFRRDALLKVLDQIEKGEKDGN